MARPSREVRLDLNTLPFVNEGALRAALSRSSLDALGNYPDPTAGPLRNALAESLNVPLGRIWTGNGSDDLLDRLVRACVPPAGRIATLDPSFGMYGWFARVNGRRTLRVAADRSLPVDALARARADAYLICSPNNPTGAAFDRESIEELIERTDGLVVLDEAYAEFAGQDLRDLAGRDGRVLVVRTFSKAFGLPGIRVGYGVGSPSMIRRLTAFTPPFHLGSFGQAAAIAALRRTEFVRRAVAFVHRTRPILTDGLERLGWPFRPSSANFVLIGPVPGAIRTEARLRAAGYRVRLIPGRRRATAGHLRVTVGAPAAIRGFLGALGRYAG